MKYAILATATFLGVIAVAAAFAMDYMPEIIKPLGHVSEICGIVALGLVLYYAITDTNDWLEGDKNDRN
jgi:hypothetical protein